MECFWNGHNSGNDGHISGAQKHVLTRWYDMKTGKLDKTRIASGFANQIFHVFPHARVAALERHPLTRGLHATHLGYFPHAAHHFRRRPKGAPQHILIFCAAGEGWCELTDERLTIHAGEALLIPRSVPHAYGADATQPWTIHWFHFGGDDAQLFLRHFPAARPIVPVAPAAASKLVELFHEAYATVASGHLERPLIHLSLCLRHLFGALLFQNASYVPERRVSATKDFAPLLDFMQQRLAQPIALDELARAARLSPTHLSALFREQMGLPPVAYHTHLRIRRACHLLESTTLTITETAHACGYDDPYHFSRVFRRETGVSPRLYRNQRER